MKGLKKLEKQEQTSLAEVKENVFLIDWLTVVYHGCTVDDVKDSLGMNYKEIPWEDEVKFRNGYPCQCYWNGITISYGADDPRFAKDPTKVRTDMGICLNLSGTGCRAFESYGHGDWFRLLAEYFTLRDTGVRIKKGRQFSYNITRLDLAFDDHTGLLDLHRIRQDTESRYYVSKAKYAEYVWSDDQDKDIQGMTVQVGSDKSDIKVRIYDKAAERGFKDRHWIRVELQLRDDRARLAADDLVKEMDIGHTVSGILMNYLTFREPSEDSNKSRWPIADYWQALLTKMSGIKLWIAPGEEYNFSKTEHWLCKQYGQAIVVLDELHDDPFYLIEKCRQLYPVGELAPKYQKFLARLDPKKPFDIISAPEADSVFDEFYSIFPFAERPKAEQLSMEEFL